MSKSEVCVYMILMRVAPCASDQAEPEFQVGLVPAFVGATSLEIAQQAARTKIESLQMRLIGFENWEQLDLVGFDEFISGRWRGYEKLFPSRLHLNEALDSGTAILGPLAAY